MSSAAEPGVVIGFIRSSYACRDYVQLADAIVAACGEFGLSAYDAAHLELALRTGLPLATLDANLAKAATTAGVPIFGAH